MLYEGFQEIWAGGDFVESCFGANRQVCDGAHLEIGELMILGMSPAPFHWIRIWRISREAMGLQRFALRQKCLHQLGTMNPCSIPYHLYWTRYPLSYFPQKVDNKLPREIHLWRKKAKDKAGPLGFATDGDCPNSRDLPTTIPCRKKRSLPSRGQGSLPNRKQLKTRFVQENQGCPFLEGFFLISGRVSASQVATASGFLSRATFSGLWKDQPSLRVRILKT